MKKVKIFMIDDAAPRAAAAASGSAEAKFKECGTLEASKGDTVAAVQAAACVLLGITAELIYSQCGNTPLAESGDTGGGDGAEVGGLGDAASHVRLWDFTPKKLTKVLDATMTVAAWCTCLCRMGTALPLPLSSPPPPPPPPHPHPPPSPSPSSSPYFHFSCFSFHLFI